MTGSQDNLPETTRIDDPFPLLQECRELFVSRLGEILQRGGVQSAELTDAACHAAGETHDALAGGGKDGFDGTAGLTASRISLVGNDDLEIDIRISDIASHLRDDKRIEHWRVQLRYMTLLRRPHMKPDENPLGMEPIRSALWAISRAHEASLDRLFNRLQQLESVLKEYLPELYRELNEHLERRGVQPAAAHLVQASAGPSRAGGSGAAGTDPLAALRQSMQRQQGAEGSPELLGASLSGGTAGVAGAAGGMVSSGQTAGSGQFVIDAAAQVMLKHLAERLDAIERRQEANGVANNGDTIAENTPSPLRSKDLDLPPGQPAAVAFDTLAAIFDAIFASPDLADPIKAIYGRLQIPLLKKALADEDFFTDAQHPARLFVDALARAAVGLPDDAGHNHPRCRVLADIAERAKTELASAQGNLAPLLTALQDVRAQLDRSTAAGAEAYAHLTEHHERRELAMVAAQAWLQRSLTRTREPALVHFLSVYWVRLMQEACLAGGTEGAAWKEGETVVNHLLWSVQPKQSAEDRQKLTALLPALLKRLTAGLDHLGVSAAERKPFLDACFELQTGALRGRQADVGGPLPPPAPQANAAPSGHGRLIEDGDVRVRYFGRPAHTAPPRREDEGPQIGDWLVFEQPDESVSCGRLCWQGASSRTQLLFNEAWQEGVALSPLFLEQQIYADKARIVGKFSLFDGAAEQALKRLRDAR